MKKLICSDCKKKLPATAKRARFKYSPCQWDFEEKSQHEKHLDDMHSCDSRKRNAKEIAFAAKSICCVNPNNCLLLYSCNTHKSCDSRRIEMKKSAIVTTLQMVCSSVSAVVSYLVISHFPV